MTFNAVLGVQNVAEVPLINKIHPAVIKGMAFRQDGRVLSRGTLVAKDMNGELAAYDPDLSEAGEWTGETSISVGTVILPTVSNDRYYRCITAGDTGISEPSWPEETESVVADGTVVWQEAGLVGVDDLSGCGVLADQIDTSKEVVGSVIRHGTVNAEYLLVGDSPVTSSHILALEAIGVFVI